LFVDLAEFPCFVPDLALCDHKIVLQIKTKQFYDHIMQELVKRGNSAGSTNNTVSSFGLIECNLELPDIY